ISRPARSENGYRAFDPFVLEELRFIRLAQSVGFTLNEIKPAIPVLRNPDPTCPRLRDALEQQMARVETKIAQLQQNRATLQRWLGRLPAAVD
ncbi:MAG: MerR family DNA-binding protein, partial [Pseudomonadota bacterium]